MVINRVLKKLLNRNRSIAKKYKSLSSAPPPSARVPPSSSSYHFLMTMMVLSKDHLMFVPSFPSSAIICPPRTFYKSSGHWHDVVSFTLFTKIKQFGYWWFFLCLSWNWWWRSGCESASFFHNGKYVLRIKRSLTSSFWERSALLEILSYLTMEKDYCHKSLTLLNWSQFCIFSWYHIFNLINHSN